MKTLFVLLLAALCAASKTKTPREIVLLQGTEFLTAPYSGFCDDKDVTQAYRASFYDFVLLLYKDIATRANFNFLFAPLSIWRSLAALAEGADPTVQPQLFKFLSLPNDPCTRQKYYDIMQRRIVPGDKIITNKRILVIDEDSTVNQNWLDLVYMNSMLEVTSAPIKRYPLIAANYIRQIMSAPLRTLNLEGNSVMLDSFEYNALWTTAFNDAVTQRAPFYDQLGQKIGSVDLMTTKKRVRMVYVPDMDMKVVELPIGVNGRYRILIGIILTKDNDLMLLVDKMTNSLVTDMIDNLKESEIPIEVAIPRFTMTSDIDFRVLLEDVGLSSLWTDPAATRYISEPPALPSSYAQRATVTFNKQGISPTSLVQEPSHNASTGLDPVLGRDFIANQPFLFSILDAETYTCLISAAYTKPTYSN